MFCREMQQAPDGRSMKSGATSAIESKLECFGLLPTFYARVPLSTSRRHVAPVRQRCEQFKGRRLPTDVPLLNLVVVLTSSEHVTVSVPSLAEPAYVG